MDIDAQYDKIYRFCYYHMKNRILAEDITQETFLRWFSSDTYRDRNQALHYLYTIARNLCINESRRKTTEQFTEDMKAAAGDPLDAIALRLALEKLSEQDRELVLLRYVNKEPIGFLCEQYGLSRFALYRRLKRILSGLKEELRE